MATGSPATQPSRDALLKKFNGHTELAAQFNAVPFALYDHGKDIGLDGGDLAFVCAVLKHKWDDKPPYPSLQTIATESGTSLSTATRTGAGLAKRGLIRVTKRGANKPSEYDLEPLFDGLVRLQNGEDPAAVRADLQGRFGKAHDAPSPRAAAQTIPPGVPPGLLVRDSSRRSSNPFDDDNDDFEDVPF